MSNTNGTIIQPTAAIESNVRQYESPLYRPDGSVGVLTVKIGAEESPTAAEEREHFFLTVDPRSLTARLEREVTELELQLSDYTGYDKQGEPILRYTGREREKLVHKFGIRRNALALANQNRIKAENMQAVARRNKEAEQVRINAAAQVKAQQLIEQHEIDRRAKQIAARAGVRD